MAKELYVGHISENATEEDIINLFSVMGTVTSVHLIIDPETKEFKRCGYVRMAASVDPDEVVETLDGALLLDRQITVSIARPKLPGMSKTGTAGKFGGPRKQGGFGRKTEAAPQAGTGARKSAESAAKPEEVPAFDPKKRAFRPPSARPKKTGDESKSRTGRNPDQGRKPSGRPPRDGGRKK